MAKCDKLSLKAVFSRSLKSAQETAKLVEHGTPELYSADAGVGRTYHDLLLREDVQAVIVALPILSQPEYIEAALAAGKHVLAEKPVAPDVAAAKKLLAYYRGLKNQATLAVAENARFYPSFVYAREQARSLGRLTHFSIRVFSHMGPDNRFFHTEWRKTPGYQGGFLLDGGVHHAASSRFFLAGSEDAAEAVIAYSQQAQAHLPPIDTINAVIKTRSGASGSFQHSAGTNLRAFVWDLGYEKGTINVAGEKVTVTTTVQGGEDKETIKEFTRTSGVAEEVDAWAQGIADGKPNPAQSPEEALADLEFMEKIFQSGARDGAPQKYEFQL